MTELMIVDPKDVRHITSLQHYMLRHKQVTERPSCRIPLELLEELDQGPLGRYRLSTDAVAFFICGANGARNYLCIMFDNTRYKICLQILEGGVEVHSHDRQTGREIRMSRIDQMELVPR